jgi:hypothetical protein
LDEGGTSELAGSAEMKIGAVAEAGEGGIDAPARFIGSEKFPASISFIHLPKKFSMAAEPPKWLTRMCWCDCLLLLTLQSKCPLSLPPTGRLPDHMAPTVPPFHLCEHSCQMNLYFS